ncbi:MAG: hypothetical protein JWP52_2585 [Rhizobacter sp.]|nr:hypothetical protein [Rhizobacter sp.]
MKLKQLAAVALLAASFGAAFASEEATKFNDATNAPATRSEVQAELALARTNGTAFRDGTATVVKTPSGPSVVDAAAVKNEARQFAKSKTQKTRTWGSYYGS